MKYEKLFRRKTSFVGVDLDYSSIYLLLKEYLHSLHLFPRANVEGEISSSGTGFHIRIYLEEGEEITALEDLLYRSVLSDDPKRIILTMKKFFMNPDEEHLDLIFNEKWGEKVTKLDMKELLRKYQEEVNYVVNNWGDEGCFSNIKKIVKGVKPKIKSKMKATYMTIFSFNGERVRDKMERVCEDTRVRDESFKYKIYQSYSEGYDYTLVLFSGGKDQAYARGNWFLEKAIDEDDLEKFHSFKDEKGRKRFYWVKEKKK